MFAWKMTRPVNLFALDSGLPLVGLGSFALQTSIGAAGPLLFRSRLRMARVTRSPGYL